MGCDETVPSDRDDCGKGQREAWAGAYNLKLLCPVAGAGSPERKLKLSSLGRAAAKQQPLQVTVCEPEAK